MIIRVISYYSSIAKMINHEVLNFFDLAENFWTEQNRTADERSASGQLLPSNTQQRSGMAEQKIFVSNYENFNSVSPKLSCLLL